MSVNINLHNVVNVKIEETENYVSENPLKNNEEYTFYTRDIVFVQEDGTKTVVSMFSDELTTLIPAFVDSEED